MPADCVADPTTQITLETDTPLSQSQIWQWLKQSYHQPADSLWATIPYKVTSNYYQAQSYAKLCCSMLKDCIAEHQHQPKQPFYIIELGAGHGLLSAYLAHCLEAEKKKQQLTDYPTHHILVDYSTTRIQNWQTMPRFKKLHEQGRIDFICTDLTQCDRAMLHHQQIPFKKLLAQNPSLIIGHYILDSLPIDVFYKDHHKSHRLHFSFSTTADNLISQRHPKHNKQVNAQYHNVALTTPPYQQPRMDQLLDEQLHKLSPNSYYHYPIGSLRCLEFICTHTKNQPCMVMLQDFFRAETTAKPFHHISQDVFFNPVNLDPVIDLLQGLNITQTHQTHLCKDLDLFSFTPNPQIHWPHTTNCLQTNFAANQFDSYRYYSKALEKTQANSLATQKDLLNTLHNDPILVMRCLLYYYDKLASDPTTTHYFLEKIKPFTDLFIEKDWHMIKLSMMHRTINNATEAMAYYHQISQHCQNTLEGLEHGIWCYQQTQQPEKAKALQHNYQKKRHQAQQQRIQKQLQSSLNQSKRILFRGAFAVSILFFCFHLWQR